MLIVHVAAGGLALLSGAAALSFRKGGRLHGKAGTIFFLSMSVMTLVGAAIAGMRSERGTAVIGIFTCYLVATSWTTVRRREGGAGRPEILGLAVVSSCAAAFLAFGLIGANAPNGRFDSLPAGVHYPFAALAALAVILDLRVLRQGVLSGVQRISRHLWRMCTALLIAALSFFLGQQKVMPDFMRGSPYLYLPEIVIFGAMIFWLFRVRFARAFRLYAPRRVAPVSP